MEALKALHSQGLHHGNIRPAYIMMTEHQFSIGDYIKTSRFKLLDNLLLISETPMNVQRCNAGQQNPLYCDKSFFRKIFQPNDPSQIESLLPLDISSCETFALGLIALELGLMTELASKVCNFKEKTFEAITLEKAFSNFSNQFSNYPQLIKLIHELVGAKTEPRINPNYILEFKSKTPQDLNCLGLSKSITQTFKEQSLFPERVSPNSNSFKADFSSALKQRYPSKTDNQDKNQTQTHSQDSKFKEKKDPADETRIENLSNTRPYPDGTKTLIAKHDYGAHHVKQQDYTSNSFSTPERPRSISPSTSHLQASPYRGILTPKASRSVSPALQNQEIPVQKINFIPDTGSKRKRYVNKVDVMTNSANFVVTHK